MMALPLLPEGEIITEFERLQRQAESLTLAEFAEYVNNTWISGGTWSPADWTIFKQAVRTNNDLEGWHHGINRRAAGKSQLPLYFLIKLLHQEAQLTAIQIRLVSEKKLRRIQGRKYRDMQAEIFISGNQYESNQKSARQLLKACSFLNGPV